VQGISLSSRVDDLGPETLAASCSLDQVVHQRPGPTLDAPYSRTKFTNTINTTASQPAHFTPIVVWKRSEGWLTGTPYGRATSPFLHPDSGMGTHMTVDSCMAW
jgi:hypothetical protein